MVAQQEDRGAMLYDSNTPSAREKKETMIIIYEGTLAITTRIDSGEDVVLDYVKKGTVMNAHNFLAARPETTSTKCLTSVTYYYLPVYKITAISEAYPDLRKALYEAQRSAMYDYMLNLNPLDYQEMNFKFEENYRLTYGDLTQEELEKVPKLRLMLKNAVLHHLLELRKGSR